MLLAGVTFLGPRGHTGLSGEASCSLSQLLCLVVFGATSTTHSDMMTRRGDPREGSMVAILLAVLHISTHARALLLLLPNAPSLCSSSAAAMRHLHPMKHQHQPANQLAMLSPITTAATAARAAPGGRHSQTSCSAAAKSIVSQHDGTDGISTRSMTTSIDRDVDGGSPLTRAEALTGFVAAVVSSGALLSEVSRARADGGAGPSGLGVVDDLLADCPSVRGEQHYSCCNTSTGIYHAYRIVRVHTCNAEQQYEYSTRSHWALFVELCLCACLATSTNIQILTAVILDR